MLDKEDSIQFIETILGDGVLSNGGLNISVVCPFCLKQKGSDYSNKKLVIKTDDHRLHCWVCEYKAKNLLHLVRIKTKEHGIEILREYQEKFLNKISPNQAARCTIFNGLELFDDAFEEVENTVYEAPILPEGTMFLADYYYTRNENYYVNRHIKYLENRGLGDYESLWRWKFCVAPQTDKEYAWRVIVPSFDSEGNLNFFTGRSIRKDAYMRYLNCIVPKKTIIFNEYMIDWSKPVMLVEGPFDMFKMRKATSNVIPALGKKVTEYSAIFQKIVQNKTPVIIALDPEEIGLQNKTAELFRSYEINVKTLEYPTWVDDLGSLTEDDAVKIYQTKVKEYDAFAEFKKSIWRIS